MESDKTLTAKFELEVSAEGGAMDDVTVSCVNKLLMVRFAAESQTRLIVTDIHGRVLEAVTVEQTCEATLPMHAYPTGIYLLIVKNNDTSRAFKFVVE